MNYNEKYQKWVSKEDLDPALKAELLSMDETAKEDAFYTDVEFGTAGMRGILGAGTNRLNIYVIQKANVGFAKYIASLPEGKERGVAIGYDNRHMSYKFAIESAKVLATYGIKSYIFESLRPTPELSFAVRYLKCAGGIMITASHNPKEHNGYKVGLLLSLCMFLLAEPFATQIAAQPHALFSLLAIAPAALFGCLTAVERGYWEGLQNMTPTALSQALEAVAKLGFGLALCMWVLRNPEVVCRWVPPEVPLSALAAAGAVLGVTLSTVLGWVYFLLHGLRRDTRLPRDDRPAAPVSQIFRRLLYVMIPVALGSLVTNLTSLLDLVTMMRCLGRVQMFHGAELAERFGAFAAQPDFPAFVYGSFTGMAITVFNLVPSVTNMLGKSALPCAAALWAKQDCLGTAAHVRSVTGAAAAMAFPAAGGLWVLAEPVMHLLYAGRPEEAAIAAEALRTLLPGMVCLCLTFPLCSVLQGIGRAGIPVLCMLAGVAVKLAGNLLLLSRPAFCITGAGIATSACYLVLLLLILWQLHRCLGVRLHLLRGLFPPAAAAACCTGAAWLCHTYAQPLGMLLSAAAASGVGCLVYLAVWGLLMRCRKRKALI